MRNSGWSLEFSRQFQCLPVNVVHGQSQFSFPFLILSFKMTSASVCKLKIVLNSVNICSNEAATNCCHCHKIMFALGRSFNFFVEIVTKYRYSYDILSDLWFTREMRLQTRRLESLSIWPGVSLAAIHYVQYRSQRCITTPSKPKVELKYKYHYENA